MSNKRSKQEKHSLLADKCRELVEGEAALTAAAARYDADAVIAARQRVEALRQIVSGLEVEAKKEHDSYWRAVAERLTKLRVESYRAGLVALDVEVVKAREVIRQATAVTQTVYGRWHRSALAHREIALLRLRYPGLTNGSTLPALPLPPNVAVEVFALPEVQAAGRVLPLVAGVRASASPEERERDGYRALRKYVKRFVKELSPEVQALFAAVGVPDPGPEQPPVSDGLGAV